MSEVRMLVTDLDGTLLGDDYSLSRFRDWRVNGGSDVVLVFATGRTCADVTRLVTAGLTPTPDYTIGALGTELFDHASNTLATIGPRHGQSHWDAQAVRRVLSRFPAVSLQPGEFQSQYKSSFFFPSATCDQLQEIREALAQARLDFETIYSGDRYLDVLPRGVSKGSTARLLAARLDIPPDRVVACGDSGNDASLFVQGFRGVLVSNAEQAILDAAPEETYRTTTRHANGVLDGLEYWRGRCAST